MNKSETTNFKIHAAFFNDCSGSKSKCCKGQVLTYDNKGIT